MADVPTSANGGSRPVPDPTVLTDAAIAKEATARTTAHESLQRLIDSQFATRDERLAGIDKATELRLRIIDSVPSMVEHGVQYAREIAQLGMDHQREVSDIRFAAAERLATRESELNALALAAAFAAQKEASAKEAEYTRIASAKQDSATSEAINKLGELFDTRVGGVEAKVDDVRTRMTGIENRGVGTVEQRADARANSVDLRGWIAGGIGLAGFLILLFDKVAK